MSREDTFTPDEIEVRFPFLSFFLKQGCWVIAINVLFYFKYPSVFADEIRHWRLLFPWVLVLGLPLSLFEYLYHRYLLHNAVLPWMSVMNKLHQQHHGLTDVKADIHKSSPALFVEVDNQFAIESEPQQEAMKFPDYGLGIFYGIFLVVLALPIKLILPHVPAVLATIIAVTLYYIYYELWHAVLHFPYTRFWKPRLEKKWYSPLVRWSYGFHLMHHFRPTANLAVVGFWGVAVWDYFLKTHRRPKRLPLPNSKICYGDGVLPRPAWPLRILDRWQKPMAKWARRVDDRTKRLFKRPSTT